MIKKTYTILLLFLALLPALSQQRIIKKTYDIVDTTKSEFEQALSVYDWITHNIAYDTKQLTKGRKYYSPVQTLKKRKAICYGYSELFHSMCEILNIESYIINGYAKGFDYMEEEEFYKANHSWNIIRIDTNWLVVDATWGSGTLDYSYGFIDKLEQLVRGDSGVKNRIEFTQSPNHRYFNAPPTGIISTHLPLDAKWQLRHYPISYDSFISGEHGSTDYIDYEKEISKIRYFDSYDQSFIEAINSIKYNPYNKFDIAYQYYFQASNLITGKKIRLDSVLLKNLIKAVDYYDTSLQYVQEFKSISREFYYAKKQNQKIAFRIGSKSLKYINRIPTTLNGNLDNKYKILIRNENKLDKIESALNHFSLLTNRDIEFNYDSVNNPDTLQIQKYLIDIEASLGKVHGNIVSLTQDNDSIKNIFAGGCNHNEMLLSFTNSFDIHQTDLLESIELMDEFKALKACLNLVFFYSKYDSVMESKHEVEEGLKQYFEKMNSKYERTEKSLDLILRNYERLAKISGDNKSYSQMATETKDLFRKLYSLRIETVKYLKIHNNSWKNLLSEQNQILTRNSLTGNSVLSDKLQSFYNYISNRNELNYSNDIDLYDKIRIGSRNGIRANKKIIRDFEKKQMLN